MAIKNIMIITTIIVILVLRGQELPVIEVIGDMICFMMGYGAIGIIPIIINMLETHRQLRASVRMNIKYYKDHLLGILAIESFEGIIQPNSIIEQIMNSSVGIIGMMLILAITLFALGLKYIEHPKVEQISKIVDKIVERHFEGRTTKVKHQTSITKVTRTQLKEPIREAQKVTRTQIEAKGNYELELLTTKARRGIKKLTLNEIREIEKKLINKMKELRITGRITQITKGDLTINIEMQMGEGVKVAKVQNIQDDLAMALQAETIRIQAPIPGRDVVGIEIPNKVPSTVYLRNTMEDPIYQTSKMALPMILGHNTEGNTITIDMKKQPHLLVAGTTGSGKSVGINAMLLTLIYKKSPEELRLVLIDPKILEFKIYEGLPHLYRPIITEVEKAVQALEEMETEMDSRYQRMSEAKVKDIDTYNKHVKAQEIMPYIVIVIDELADLIMMSGKKIEKSIVRLAQKARAAGIHLIVATQRPSVDVVTGLIKANFPSRLSYRVSTKVDSRVILDSSGAETLLGRGDGLYMQSGSNELQRIHAPYNTEKEILKVITQLQERYPNVEQPQPIRRHKESNEYKEAIDYLKTVESITTTELKNKLNIGYPKAQEIIQQLETNKRISSPQKRGRRIVL